MTANFDKSVLGERRRRQIACAAARRVRGARTPGRRPALPPRVLGPRPPPARGRRRGVSPGTGSAPEAACPDPRSRQVPRLGVASWAPAPRHRPGRPATPSGKWWRGPRALRGPAQAHTGWCGPQDGSAPSRPAEGGLDAWPPRVRPGRGAVGYPGGASPGFS